MVKKEQPRRLPKVYQEQADKRLKERIKSKKEKMDKMESVHVEPVVQEEPKVAKFTLTAQTSRLANHTGPSGMNYIMNIGIPFEVRNKEDVDYFKANHRFERKTIFSKKPEKPKDVEETLKEYILKIKGVSEKTADNVVKEYIHKKNLEDELQQGYIMPKSIPVKQAEKIKKYVLKEIVGDK